MWTFIKPQHSWAETHVTLPYCSDLRSFRHIYFKRPPTLNMHKHVSCHTCAHSFHHKILFLTPCLIPVNCNNLCHIDSPHSYVHLNFFSFVFGYSAFTGLIDQLFLVISFSLCLVLCVQILHIFHYLLFLQ